MQALRARFAAALALASSLVSAEQAKELPVSDAGVAGALIAIHALHNDEIATDMVHGTLVITPDSIHFAPDNYERNPTYTIAIADILDTNVRDVILQRARIYVVTEQRVYEYWIPRATVGRVLRLLMQQ